MRNEMAWNPRENRIKTDTGTATLSQVLKKKQAMQIWVKLMHKKYDHDYSRRIQAHQTQWNNI